MQLSNLVFIVMLILLIIILIILYFFSSDIRKNKNNLNIAESNILSLREKISSMNDKFELLEKKIKNNQMNPDNFSEMLNQLNSINQEIMPNNMMFPMSNEDDDEEDEDYEDDDNDDDDDDDDEDDDNDDEDDDDDNDDDDENNDDNENEDSDNEDSDDDDDSDDEESTKKNDKNKKDNSSMNSIEEDVVVEIKSDPEIKKIVQIEEKPTNLNKDSDTKSQSIGIDDIMDSNDTTDEKPKSGLKKQPKKSIQDCLVGSVEVGDDGETQFKVALNKAGRKFWKKV